jgi:predicted nucleic acid-binding protein
MRVVFDTNILVRGAMSPDGLASALLTVLQELGHELVISTWLLQ